MITYRPLKEEDLEFFNATRNECREFLHDNREFTLEQTKEWFKSLPLNQKYYIITNGAQSLGYIRTNELNTQAWEIGMDLAEKFRGLGIAHTMYRKFMHEHPEPRVWVLEVLATNLPAYNLYRKLGFNHAEDEGINDVERNGRLIPSIPMYRYRYSNG